MNKKLLGAVLVVLASRSVWSEDFDGSKPLLCATIEAYGCVPNDRCMSGTPAELGAPGFLRVNVEKKEVKGPERTTAIKNIEKSDEQLLLMGTELGLGWTLALNRATGEMSGTIVSGDGAFVLFGACTVP